MADEKAPLLTDQGGPAQPPYQGEAQQAPPPQAPPYSGQPQAPPPQGGQYGGAYQQPPGYQSAPPPQQNTTVVVQPTSTVPLPMTFGESPVQMTCPNCRVQNRTTVTYTAGLMTWLLVGALFFFGFWLCCWIPLIIDGCKDVTHICPNCHYTVGTYKRL